ncbi:MAG: hypothetical protein M1814_003970 [Vezdaea aestivalis]|nr:MAG: hypothetical protein M1814_003970 [Vezdaea aestivalis]
MSSKLQYIFNHVFLPPRLPQEDDESPAKATALIEHFLEALRLFYDSLPEERLRWIRCIKMLENILILQYHGGKMSVEKLKTVLMDMEVEDVLALFIRSQNSGLIIRRSQDHHSFESFEVLPSNEAVFETKGRLKRCFPGPCVAISKDRIADTNFSSALAELLIKLDTETPTEAIPDVRKANSKVHETRDTVHPRFVTKMLTGILRGIGWPLDASRIYKHTREEVSWKDAYMPWRRSPLWLFLRVILQTSLSRHEDKAPSECYKSFMVFFMSQLLEKALHVSFSNEMLYIMISKIVGRALKLKTSGEPAWLQRVRSSVLSAQTKIGRDWDQLQEELDPLGTLKDWLPSRLSFSNDINLSVQTLDPYLAKDWLNENLEKANVSVTLAKVIDRYIKIASSAYSEAPEAISLMILTIMDLWIALDKCSIHHCPLLREYNPEIEIDLFEPLLLPTKDQMRRLHRIESYLLGRGSAAASLRNPSIFRSINTSNSFAARYFDQSSHHQALRREIVAKASMERSSKVSELVTKERKYQTMMQQASALDCEEILQRRRGRQVPVHSNSCRRCQLENSAKALQIDVHEWPLPERDQEAKAVVFEIDIPIAFSEWRDSTYGILVDVLSTDPGEYNPRTKKKEKAKHLYDLNDTGLGKYFKAHHRRIKLASASKPFTVSHYRKKKISRATEEDVCVNNGLNYEVYDSKLKTWTKDFEIYTGTRQVCTFQLPAGPYKRLQYTVDNTIHTSNNIIAKQANCAKAITYHEFYAFGTLRSGHVLQWRNIVREIIDSVLDFNREEVYMLIVQAAWQVGPASREKFYRQSHVDLREGGFGLSLLSTLNDALKRLEGSWQNATSLRIFIILAARLLSLSTSSEIHNACFWFLRRARTISLNWTRVLVQKLLEGKRDDETKELNARALETALTCYETFAVDEDHVQHVLESDEDVAIITECATILHDRCPDRTSDLSPSTRTSLRCFWRVSRLLEARLRSCILKDRAGIDRTITRFWAGYTPGVSWSAMERPNDRWILTKTSSEGGLISMPIHYNLQDGSLLINGISLTRLPHEYESHPTFRRLFGDGEILDVVPSSMSGMLFETRNKILDFQVFFGMYDSELIIRTKKGEEVLELLPVHALQDDFPRAFIHEFTHWLNKTTGIVQWRPLKRTWSTSSGNWQMNSGRVKKVLAQGYCKMIDYRSPTATMVSKILSPLDEPAHIHIFFNCERQELEVHLPRFKLDFFLAEGTQQLESKQFRGMIVNGNQSIGTFTSLANKLVLRTQKGSQCCVIIPHGTVQLRSEGPISVNINKSTSHVPYQVYHVDSQLGRLVDNGSLRSKLYKCYLHAVTSHCLPDTLTGRTGTEQALAVLKSACAHSFLSLEKDEIDLLLLLANLTPIRQFYPNHLRVMQQSNWKTLPQLSQHDAFFNSVESILDHARMLEIFQEQDMDLPYEKVHNNLKLLERAAIRNSTFRIHGFGAEKHTTKYDQLYNARDCVSDDSLEARVHRNVGLVDNWSEDLNVCSDILSMIKAWSKPLQGPKRNSSLSLGYDKKWLAAPAMFLPEALCTLQPVLATSVAASDKYRIMIFLATLTFSPHADDKLVQTLLAFATIPRLRALRPPNYPLFELSKGFTPKRTEIINIIETNTLDYASSLESNLPDYSHETFEEAEERRRACHQSSVETHSLTFVDALIRQWPDSTPYNPIGRRLEDYFIVDDILQEVTLWFEGWSQNSDFLDYTNQLQDGLRELRAENQDLKQYVFLMPRYLHSSRMNHVRMEELMKRSAPNLPLVPEQEFDCWINRQDKPSNDRGELDALLRRLSLKASSGYEQRYVDDLWKSFESLHDTEETTLIPDLKLLEPTLLADWRSCQDLVKDIRKRIKHALKQGLSIAQQLAYKTKMWPRKSEISLLQNLDHNTISSLKDDWKLSLINYGLAISNCQRTERLFLSIGSKRDLLNELNNSGRQHWDPIRYPDWLLFEIENNVLIRPVQAAIAQEMICPTSCANSVLQLNMGEGKSSVIVPIAVAALADRTKLVRVVVLKPLSRQMFILLRTKLSGMLGRRVFQLPISRSLQLDDVSANHIREICERCMAAGGVILVQPEHILSFEQMGIEKLIAGQSHIGKPLIDTQQWLECNSRDILDESDEILSVRFELTYTMGTQHTIEFGPARWTVIEDVLNLVRESANILRQSGEEGIDMRSVGLGRFPRTRILQTHVADTLLHMVASAICNRGLSGVSVWKLSPLVREALLSFLIYLDVSDSDSAILQNHIPSASSTWKSVLLLRGLIAGGVLAFALCQKRWRVHYGLDLSRTMLAVPYRAKDDPALRAEFSHPDATIVFTCLSYYYEGLSDVQLRIAFEKLLICENSEQEYEQWIKDAPGLQPVFRQLTGVNLKDNLQCSEDVFPSLRYAKGAIDFYMSNMVFPKEMKEFPHKLSSSGWDLARIKTHPTTGFSGTNDSRHILPLSISQRELPKQVHTNASVLNYLLRPENTYQNTIQGTKMKSFDAESLLQLIIESEPPVRVLLDVGAQVLEWKNEEVAHRWLSNSTSAVQAAIFFNEKNDLVVLSRDKTIEPLMISPFAKQMDRCLVYLDESHTRGTDLKLPADYRAAVTLGPGLTKDRLVQACMRLRNLGKGQSVMFCAPNEVEDKILQNSEKNLNDTIEVADIIQWSISETCAFTKKCVPLWASQGTRYQRRHTVWPASLTAKDGNLALEKVELMLEPEARSLQDRYGLKVRNSEETIILQDIEDESLITRRREIQAIRDKCQEFKITSFNSSALQEEQERELSPEIEQERQVERPVALKPHEHFIHPEVKRFVQRGLLDRRSNAFQAAFQLFNNTSAADKFEIEAWPKHLLVTTDFTKTVQVPGNQLLDSFLRPVHWVVSKSNSNGIDCVIISPFEAQGLLPLIREEKIVTLHMYSARTSASVYKLQNLSFCAIPPTSTVWTPPSYLLHLHLFAGLLYLESYEEYLRICRFLGICFHPTSHQFDVESDGFVSPKIRREFDPIMFTECPFTTSPVDFVQELLSMRRKGQNFRKSHLGRVLEGEMLTEEQFVNANDDFLQRGMSCLNVIM